MSTVKNARSTEKGYPKANVVSSGKNYANDPFVLKKVAEAKKMMSKIKLPDHLKK